MVSFVFYYLLFQLLVEDGKTNKISNLKLIVLFCIILFEKFMAGLERYLENTVIFRFVIGFSVLVIVFYICYKLTGKWIGAGDYKLAGLLYVYGGIDWTLQIFFWGGVIALVHNSYEKQNENNKYEKYKSETKIPLGPYLLCGMILLQMAVDMTEYFGS